MSGRRLTGLKFPLFSGSFFLYRGFTWAPFSPDGNLYDLYVVFMRSEMTPLTDETQDLRVLAEILSTLVAFFVSKFEMALCTYFF